jgi:plastocyanin
LKTVRTLLVALLAVAALGACSSDTKTGDQSSLAFDQEQAGKFGASTSTTEAGATETTAAPTTAPPTTGANTTLPPEQQQVTIDVSINGQSPYFDPSLVQVVAGSKVRFTNNDSQEHSVVSDVGAFDSGPIAPGKAWIFDATSAGRFNYSDGGRPFAVGAIEVQ